MTETSDKPEDQAPLEIQPGRERPPLREVSADELKQILAAHEKWLESDGKEGKQAVLGFANLQGADLTRANLQGANLSLTNLQGANLVDAKLQGANLRGAKRLTQEQLDRACGDTKTKLPPNLSIQPCPEASK